MPTVQHVLKFGAVIINVLHVRLELLFVKTIGFYAKGFGNGMNARKCNVRT